MELHDAIQLIKPAITNEGPPGIWADLGCGEGLFSRALLSLLPNNSIVHAVDMRAQPALNNTPGIIFHQLDFSSAILPVDQLNGILMANSLHYVKDQLACIANIKKYLVSGAKIILIEYDTTRSNQWVPYPVSFLGAKELFLRAGFSSIKKIGERHSIYRNDPIYAALISSSFDVPGFG